MAFFEIAKEFITKKPPNLKGPHFYKIDSDLRRQLEQLKEFYKTAPDHIKPQVEQDMQMLHYGIAGEEQVAFELNNSYIPMIILHDLHIKYEGLTSQIDFMIITTKVILIVECKNLYGNIEVNDRGEFIRTFEYKGKLIREGIYSPITQNARHLDMIKKIRLTSKSNFLTRLSFLKYFEETYKSVVVLANPKTVIDLKYAKKEVKDQIIRCDQLVAYIKRLLKESRNEPWFEKQMYELADFFLSFHTPNTTDYTRKYVEGDWKVRESAIPQVEVKLEETPLYKELRQYRYEISKATGLKPYMVFTNAELVALISTRPRTLNDLKTLSGFGDVKCERYRKAIL